MKISIRFMGGNIVDDVLYFSASNFNGLFKMKLDTQTVHFIDSFIDTPLNLQSIHRSCLVYNRWLIFIPMNSDKIHFVNIDNHEQRSVRVTDGTQDPAIADAIIVGNLLYVFPAKKGQPSMIVHLDDMKVETLDKFNEQYNSIVPDSPHKSKIVSVGAVIRDDSIYMGLYSQNKVLKYNLKSEIMEMIDTQINSIFDVYNGKDGIWVSDLDGKQIELLSDRHKIYETEEKKTYRRILDLGEYIYLIPGNADEISMIKGTKVPVNMKYPDEFKTLERLKVNKFFGYKIYNDDIYLFPYAHDNMLVISGDKLRTVKTVYETDPAGSDPKQLIETIQAYRGRIIRENGGLITESPEFTLDSYMEYIGLLD